ncbi:hypothetical protein [Pluralibacter gergoviae]|uniref:hypothetical protein n=1 Tax=Pluralibacter gergoviae TaxID=61647 RepID=UPI0012FF53E2|nr:hypothetical protein [Pluralibacter gergoviae]
MHIILNAVVSSPQIKDEVAEDKLMIPKVGHVVSGELKFKLRVLSFESVTVARSME